MEIAPKTVEFIKEWINGTYTKRQYQNYYIVKTEHANFLMKLTERRELQAVKDPTGHVYIFDDNGDEDNGFAALLGNPEFKWPNAYTRVTSRRLGHRYNSGDKDPNLAINQISKFRVCERVFLNQKWSNKPLFISLIALGNRRFYTWPDHDMTATDKKPLKQWASFQVEADTIYDQRRGVFSVLTECPPNIETVERIRGHYVDLANATIENGADLTTITEAGWMNVPTKFNTIDDISGLPLLEMRKSRPNPYGYGVTAAHFDLDKLSRRHETTEENVGLLVGAITEPDRSKKSYLPDPDVDWRRYMNERFPADMAKDFIAYVEADDKWLSENSDMANASELEYQLRHPVTLVDGWLYVAKESDSRFGPYALYYRTTEPTFTRILPSPPYWARIFGGKNDYE
jgi:hypothetical protein